MPRQTTALSLYAPQTDAIAPKKNSSHSVVHWQVREPQDAFVNAIRTAAQQYRLSYRAANFLQWLLLCLPRDRLATTQIPQSTEAWLQKAATAIILSFHNDYMPSIIAMKVYFNIFLMKISEGVKPEALAANNTLWTLLNNHLTQYSRTPSNLFSPSERLEKQWCEASFDNTKPINWQYYIPQQNDSKLMLKTIKKILKQSPLHLAQWLITCLIRPELITFLKRSYVISYLTQLAASIAQRYDSETCLLSLEKVYEFHLEKFALTFKNPVKAHSAYLTELYELFSTLIQAQLREPEQVAIKSFNPPVAAIHLGCLTMPPLQKTAALILSTPPISNKLLSTTV